MFLELVLTIACSYLSVTGFDKHGNLLPAFSTNSDFGSTVWPKFIFQSFDTTLDLEQCAYACTVVDGPCNLFYFDSGTLMCYVGSFAHVGGTILTNQPGPFHQIQAQYGENVISNFRNIHVILILQ